MILGVINLHDLPARHIDFEDQPLRSTFSLLVTGSGLADLLFIIDAAPRRVGKRGTFERGIAAVVLE
jgi:hypothetical protein